jgi:RimJ/RimL family protein N-acetyltransferase
MEDLIDMHERLSHLFALEEYTMEYLDKSWVWLNDPEIKKLTLTPDFTRQQQLDFYENVKARTDYWIRGVSCDAVPVGVAGLKNISYENCEAEYWGFIGEKKYHGKGGGTAMLRMVFDEARRMGITRIYLYVWKENRVAIALYSRSGFHCDGEYGEKLKYSMVLASSSTRESSH